MFIKKDLRKIPRILADAADSVNENDSNDDGAVMSADPPSKRTKREVLTELRLQRRKAEFNGSIKILCQPQYVPSLRNLTSLSLYDCQIHTLTGIGVLASPVEGSNSVCCPNLRKLNVGRNPLITLPEELANLASSLKELWLDDCQISGALPDCILKLAGLEILRISNNKLTSIPSDIRNLECLQVLCLDCNEIESIPNELSELSSLESLMLRGNRLTSLPEGVPSKSMTSLTMLHVSSNQLETLPASLADCDSLESVFANGNRLVHLPDKLGSSLRLLERMTLSHNRIEALPQDLVERFGEPDPETGECTKDPMCVVTVSHNPIVNQQRNGSSAR